MAVSMMPPRYANVGRTLQSDLGTLTPLRGLDRWRRRAADLQSRRGRRRLIQIRWADVDDVAQRDDRLQFAGDPLLDLALGAHGVGQEVADRSAHSGVPALRERPELVVGADAGTRNEGDEVPAEVNAQPCLPHPVPDFRIRVA